MPKRPVSEAEKLMEQAFTLFQSGVSKEEIAKTMHVSLRTVHRWLQTMKAKPVQTDVQTNKHDVQTSLTKETIEPHVFTPVPEVIDDANSPLNYMEDYYDSQHHMALELGAVAVQLLPLLKNALKRFDAEDITPKTFPSLMKTVIDAVNNSNECWVRATGIDIVMSKLNELEGSYDGD